MRGLIGLFKARFALQLWLAMVALVLLAFAVFAGIHFVLFEKNYVDAAVNRIKNQVIPYLQTQGNLDSGNIDETLSYLSRLIGGGALVRANGEKSLRMYSIGVEGKADLPDDRTIRGYIETPENAEKIARGEVLSRVVLDETTGLLLVAAVPVVYENMPRLLFLALPLSELETAQDLNRRQLLRMSIFMILLVSILATLLMKYFSNPIRSITETVDRLAKGDLTAKSDIRRQDELGRLSASVTELAQALRRVSVLRKEIIANVSHELRTPLSLIAGYAEIVRDISWQDERARNENLGLIIEETGRLNEMVKDILKFSQFSSGFEELERTRCDLVDSVRKSVEFGRHVASAASIDISFHTFSEEVAADMDASKMLLVLRNLINNAVNHTVDGGLITVEILRKEDGTVSVEVANPGKAIPEEFRKTIWERYERVQHQGGRHEGSGIGLSIASGILAAHGFGYGLDCRNGCNVFWFSIPPECLFEGS